MKWDALKVSEWVGFNVLPNIVYRSFQGMDFSGGIAHIHNNRTKILTLMKHKTLEMT